MARRLFFACLSFIPEHRVSPLCSHRAGRHGTLVGNWFEETALPTPLDTTRPRFINTFERVVAHYANVDSAPKQSVQQTSYTYDKEAVAQARKETHQISQRQEMLARLKAEEEQGCRQKYQTTYQCSIGLPKKRLPVPYFQVDSRADSEVLPASAVDAAHPAESAEASAAAVREDEGETYGQCDSASASAAAAGARTAPGWAAATLAGPGAAVAVSAGAQAGTETPGGAHLSYMSLARATHQPRAPGKRRTKPA